MLMPHRREVGYGPYRWDSERARWRGGDPYQVRRRENYGRRNLSQDYFSAPVAMTLAHAIRSPLSAADHNPQRRYEQARYDSP